MILFCENLFMDVRILIFFLKVHILGPNCRLTESKYLGLEP